MVTLQWKDCIGHFEKLGTTTG